MSERDVEIAIYESHRAHELELDKATAAFEHATLSPLFLLNPDPPTVISGGSSRRF